MKILVITNLFPNETEPNRGVFVKNQLLELSKFAELQIIVPIALNPIKFLANFRKKQTLHKKNIGNIIVYYTHWFPFPIISRWLNGFLLFPVLLLTINNIKKNFSFSIIYAQWVYPDGFASVLAAKILRKKVIVHALGCDINLYTRCPIRKSMIIWTLNQSNLVFAMSENLKEKIINIGIPQNKVLNLSRGINIDLFKILVQGDCRNILQLSLEKKIILFIGAFEEVKGVDYLLTAFSSIEPIFKNNLHLVLIGKGTLEDKLRHVVEKLNILEKVMFIGEIEHSQIPIWINASDIVCLPSIREGLPNVIKEAFCCGKPVVASSVGGVPELVRSDNYGILVRPSDPNALAQGLIDALKKTWDTKEIVSYSKSFSWERMAEIYKETFLELEKTV